MRCVFALDAATLARIERLAQRWQVSQAEVVRCAVEGVENHSPHQRPDPVALLRELHATGQSLDRRKAESYLAQVQKDRKSWRGQFFG